MFPCLSIIFQVHCSVSFFFFSLQPLPGRFFVRRGQVASDYGSLFKHYRFILSVIVAAFTCPISYQLWSMITFEELYYNACSPFSLRSVYLFGRLTPHFLPSYSIPTPPSSSIRRAKALCTCIRRYALGTVSTIICLLASFHVHNSFCSTPDVSIYGFGAFPGLNFDLLLLAFEGLF